MGNFKSEAELLTRRRIAYLIQRGEEEMRIIKDIKARLLREGIEDNDDWKNKLLKQPEEEK